MSRLIAATPLVLVGRWSNRSQEQARRNAMTASTVLATRRLERLDVESFIAECLARRTEEVAEPAAALMEGVG